MALERRWVFVAFVAALAVAVSAFVARSKPTAATGSGAAAWAAESPAASRFVLVSGPVGDKQTGAFVIDQQTMRLLVYAVDMSRKQLKLVAVRDVSQDVRLSHWNNAKPWPEDIRRHVEAGGDQGDPEKGRPDASPE